MRVEYSSNNSGGSWWLTDEQWLALEAAGWKVKWCKDDKHHNGAVRWLGALATSASLECETPGDAMRAFETITGLSVSDEGCGCCGAPHSFSWGEGESWGYASGEECLPYLFNAPRTTLREAYAATSKPK